MLLVISYSAKLQNLHFLYYQKRYKSRGSLAQVSSKSLAKCLAKCLVSETFRSRSKIHITAGARVKRWLGLQLLNCFQVRRLVEVLKVLKSEDVLVVL